jgi:transposase
MDRDVACLLVKTLFKEKPMPAKIYRVTLREEERQSLKELVRHGKCAARKLMHAHILLLADENRTEGAWPDDKIAAALGVNRRTVERIRQRCVETGVEAALHHKQHSTRRDKRLDGAAEARLIQLACCEAPDGRERWTMQMLANKLIELEIVETISDETVRTTLKKTNSNLG